MNEAIETLKNRIKAHRDQIARHDAERDAIQADMDEKAQSIERSTKIIAELEQAVIKLGGKVD